MSRSSEASSQAMWDFLEAHGQKEFADVHLLATHLTDGALLHTAKKPVRSLADFRGLKLRSANRISTKLISMLGATPVAMPVPQVPEALSKGVVDGAVLPWDVVPALKTAGAGQVPHRNGPGSAGIDAHRPGAGDEPGQVRQPAR
ncbi:hypothetical protein OMD46_22440 [Pseudomonas sp. MDMC_285]|nr:hypothetical protein [Pseudomonas sp. MDMC_285]